MTLLDDRPIEVIEVGAERTVGFTGTRNGMTSIQVNSLNGFLHSKKFTEARHGDCVGADEQFHDIVMALGKTIHVHPPMVNTFRAFCVGYNYIHPPKDYIDRNHDIVDLSDIICAAPSSNVEELRSGTWATIRYARKWGKELLIFYPDGSSIFEAGFFSD